MNAFHLRGRLTVAVVVLGFALAACGGGGKAGGTLLPASGSPAATKKATVTFKVVVPKKTATVSRPAYVSPATQSMTIKVLQGSSTVISQIMALTASSPDCSSSLASVTCTLSLTLNPGSYTASITTYDGANGGGNALSTAQSVAFTVVADENNLVPLSLSGIPTNLLVTAESATSINVVAEDADGNFIVGSGAPVYTATKTAGSSVATINQPTTAQPNVISFSVPSPVPSPGSETIGITASFPTGETNACTQSGATCTASTSLTVSYGQMLLVANYSGSNILGFPLPLANGEAPAVTITTPGPYAIAMDANGDLFSDTYASPGTLSEYPAPYTSASATNQAGGADPYDLVVAPNGYVGAAGYSGGFSVFAPPYTGTPTVLQSTTDSYSVTADSSSTFYVGNSNKTVTAYASPYSGTPVTVSLAGPPDSILASGSTLFVGEDSRIEVFSLPLTGTSVPVATLTGIGDVYGLAVDSSGNLWATGEYGGAHGYGGLYEFSQPFSGSETPTVALSSPFGTDTSEYPYGIGFDSAGNVYITNVEDGARDGALLEFSPPITNSSTPSAVVDTALFDYPYYLVISPQKVLTVSL